MKEGWIKLHRSIQESDIWEKPEYLKAWIELLLTVNHKENKMLGIKAGQTLTSIKSLSQKWKWSNNKISNFLNALQKEGMIAQNRTSRNTVITVLNWDKYQEDAYPTHIQSTSHAYPTHTNKNVKNVYNEKNDSPLPLSKKKKRMTRPKPETVLKYCVSQKYMDYFESDIGKSFVAHFEARDWMLKDRAMSKWQPVVDSWFAWRKKNNQRVDKTNKEKKRVISEKEELLGQKIIALRGDKKQISIDTRTPEERIEQECYEYN